MRRLWLALGLGAGLAALVWAANTFWQPAPDDRIETRLIAHRGVHQIYAGQDRTGDACHAAKIAPPVHGHIANTLASMRAAFEFGADVVELDVHRTADDVLAVFHDWTLDCQTDGTGVTHKQSFDYLRGLDLGHGFTADDGASFPLRGTGIGAMPSLHEVLNDDLGGRYLVNFKSNRGSDGKALAALLKTPGFADQVMGVYGGAAPVLKTAELLPGMRGYDKKAVRSCLLRYAALGWLGQVPNVCRGRLMPVPLNVAPWLAGWPYHMTARFQRHGTTLILLGDYDGSGFSSGIDTPEDWARVPIGFDGYVWTDRIEVIGPLAKSP